MPHLLTTDSLREHLSGRHWPRRFLFWLGAIGTGTAAVAFAMGSDLVAKEFGSLQAKFPWWPFLGTPLGLMLSAWLTRRVFAGAEGSGVPQTIAALSLESERERDQILSMRIAIGKVVLTLLALGSGASVGREGPTVQIGASIMHSLKRFARFSTADLDRGLILAGGAAGIAAAFNTPLAGIVFAIEELSRSFEEQTSGTIVTAVIIAGVTSVSLVGNYTYFGSTSAVLNEPHMWLALPVCALFGGLLGGLFSRLLLSFDQLLPRPMRSFRLARPVLFAGACGIAIACIGGISGGSTYGTGYAQARAMLQSQIDPDAGFPLWKALATMASYMSGTPGGIFAPSLAVGAGVGSTLHAWWPVAPAGVMVILSMAAYFSGVVQAPLTALVIMTEMTGDRALTLPLMAAALLGRGASALVCRRALYRTLAQRFIPPRSSPQDASA